MPEADAPPSAIPPPISNPEEDEGDRILGAVVTVTTLAFITVLTRFYVRSFMIRNVGWDDALMALTMAVSIAGMGLAVAQVHYGAGRHRGDIDPEHFPIGMKLNFISQPIYLFAICFVKLSVGCSLLRIASTKFYRKLILGIMGFMLFYTVGCFFTIIFQCSDIRDAWDPSPDAECWGQSTLQSLSYTNVALNITTDLLFAIIIPAPMLWKLNVHSRTRISLIAILGLGVFACAAAFVKVGYLVNYGKVGDLLWDARDITIWTAAELNVGIVAGSLPTLRPIFKKFLGSVYGKGSRKTTTASGGVYGHGTNKGDNQWQTLSSGRRPQEDILDDGSSQEAITVSNWRLGEEYELKDKSLVNTTIVAGLVSSHGDESAEGGIGGMAPHRGIKKTMVTTVDYSSSK